VTAEILQLNSRCFRLLLEDHADHWLTFAFLLPMQGSLSTCSTLLLLEASGRRRPAPRAPQVGGQEPPEV